MKTSFIIPFYNNQDTIKNLLRSIHDQDYKDYQIIVVEDGPQEVVDKQFYIDNYKIIWTALKDHRGASLARNHGASLATGEVLFFLDADCQLYPGMLRECMTQLELNPEIGFVYGNYRFESKQDFFSQEFDPYLLETMNYIPTMSPMRRKCFENVGGFDEKLTFFQDWDLFYRLAKSGIKGKYIKEFIFTAKISKETNISGSQGMTLAEKAKKFRSYHGIDDKSLVVTTFSSPYQSIQRAKMLKADYVGVAMDSDRALFPSNLGFSNWKGTYLTGCFNEPLGALENHLSAIWGKPIIHFIGTDVFQLLMHRTTKELEFIKRIFKEKKAKLFANSPRLVKELSKMGIKSELLYTPIYNIDQYKAESLPKKFTVAVYCSDTQNMNGLDGELSYIPLVREVAQAMPDIHFKFFGSKMIETFGNIEMVGKIPENKMVQFINSCSMNLRVTMHDGFPQLPIQFMLCGRKALITCPDKELRFSERLNFEELANSEYDSKRLGMKTYQEAKDEIINKIYQIEQESFDVNVLSKDARVYYKELMNEAYFKERIYKEL